MNSPSQERETEEDVPGTAGARLMRIIAILLLGWSAAALIAARVLASGRPLEVIHPLKYQQHWDIHLCYIEALETLPFAAIASLITFIVRPSWSSVVLFLLAAIGWVVLFRTYLGLIT